MSGKKLHTTYKLKDGTKVPSVTTITGQLDKAQLIHWAVKVTKEGLDWQKVRDDAASIGTLTHQMIFDHLKEAKTDLSIYSEQQIGQAETCLIKYWDWEKEHQGIKDLTLELPMVSEVMRYGGTIDRLCEIDGVLTIIDYKTGKEVWPEMWYQLAAYQMLAQENGYDVKVCRILRIGREEKEGFEEAIRKDLSLEMEMFKHLRAIYDLKKGGS